MAGLSHDDPSAFPLPHELKPPADLPQALADLRASGWESVSVAEEMRRNTAKAIAAGRSLVPGVLGFEDTVIPALENAILAGHDMILLGERGQAKTRVIRSMVGLLDEWLPIVAGSEINDDPYRPVSRYAIDRVDELGGPRRSPGSTARSVTARSWRRPTPPSLTSSVRATRSKSSRAGT